MRIVEATIEVNRSQRDRMVERIREAVGGSLRGRTVAVLGLAFKPNTNDIRESPAVYIARRLREEGAAVRAYDPVAMEDARRELPDLHYCRDPYDAATGADALAFLTEWNEFRMLEMERIRDAMARPVLLDIRNLYDPDQMQGIGFAYVGVGRRPRAAHREDEG